MVVFNRINKRGTKKENPREEWVFVKDSHPAIIPIEKFNKIQGMIAEKWQKPTGAQKTDLLLVGLLVCGKCKATMTTASGNGNGGSYHYYNCRTYKTVSKDKCNGHRIRADELDT